MQGDTSKNHFLRNAIIPTGNTKGEKSYRDMHVRETLNTSQS